jgi:hypothetical protein
MKSRLLLPLAALGLLLFAAGCQTVDTRIKEKPAAFAGLDKETQEKIKQGVIGLGYTEDMIYLALGKPDQIRESLTASAHTLTWIYNSYTVHYDSAFMMGGYYRSPYYYYPYARAYGAYGYYYPPYLDAYHTETQERIRVTFSGGKVTAIDQVKDE